MFAVGYAGRGFVSLGISWVPTAQRRPLLRLPTAVSVFCGGPLSWPGSRLDLTDAAVAVTIASV